MKTKQVHSLRGIATLVAVAIFAIAACERQSPSSNGTASAQPSTYRQVLDAGVIRAGYLEYPPGCIRDINTGELRGIHIEALEKAAAAMGLRVEWVPASGWGSIVEDVRTGRLNMIGSPVWANATRGKHVDFTTPLFWSGICAYVRYDYQFDGDLGSFNSQDIRIATIDGEMSDIIARTDFPDATRVSLPENSDNSLMLENVAARKADVVFVEPYIANLYLKNNPGALKNVTPDKPLRVFPNSMMIPKDDPIRSMLNIALNELKNSGVIDDLLRKYAPDAGSFYADALPYRVDAPGR